MTRMTEDTKPASGPAGETTFACTMNRHEPAEESIDKHGSRPVSVCARCGKDILWARGRWREFDDQRSDGFLGALACLINRHRPHDHKATWDGETFISRCGRCRKPIRRIRHGWWRVDNGRSA